MAQNGEPVIVAAEGQPAAAQVGVGDIVANVIENINNMGAVDTNLFHNEKPRKPEKGIEVPEWKDAVTAALK